MVFAVVGESPRWNVKLFRVDFGGLGYEDAQKFRLQSLKWVLSTAQQAQA